MGPWLKGPCSPLRRGPSTSVALGIAESGLFPGVVFYLSMWYKRNEQHFRVALFFSAASLAGAFGGILAWVGATQTRENLTSR
jgi:MFS family permease